MLVRNEDWVIGASLRAALEWCDQVVLYLDRCTDQTAIIANEVAKTANGRVLFMFDPSEPEYWNEMTVRHQMLVAGREKCQGTHFAIIDGDEILTWNLLPKIREWFKSLKPGYQIQVPMIPVWDGVDRYRSERCAWTYRNDLTLGFCDHPTLGWQPREDGYHHHSRPPSGIDGDFRPINWGDGGVLHLQFANKRRLLAKHVLYRMVDHLRWPGRRTVAQMNRIYDEALQPAGELTTISPEWWGGHHWEKINLYGVPWQEAEIVRLLNKHGRDAFQGLDLKGF